MRALRRPSALPCSAPGTMDQVDDMDHMGRSGRRGGVVGVLLVALALIACPLSASAEDLAGTFRQGNEAFWSGSFGDSVGSYEQLVEHGVWDAEVFYNLGTAYARQGRFGPAILNFERALILSPGHVDARHNLGTVRRILARQRNDAGQDADLDPPRSFWLNLLARVTAAQVGIPFLLCWLGLFAVLAWRRLSAGELTRLVLMIAALLLAGVALVSGSLLAGKALYDSRVREAIAVRQSRAVLREGPAERFGRACEAIEGDRLRLLDREGEWLHLRDTQGREGWGRRQDFGELRRPPRDLGSGDIGSL